MRRILLALWLLLVVPAGVEASVSLKNGNFFISFTDVSYRGGLEMKIERVYNSKTAFKGIFGYGWGNEYEIYLDQNIDGSVVVHEYGGGAHNVFLAERSRGTALAGGIDDLVSAATKTGAVSAEGEAAYREKLETDVAFRDSEWQKYRERKLLRPREVPLGTILRSDQFGYQTLKRVREGWVRLRDNGRSEVFNLDGRLIRVQDRNDNFIDLEYDDRGRLTRIVDESERALRITINARGLVERIVDDARREAVYRYNDRDDLIFSQDVQGARQEYEYDARHNMTRIAYADSTTMEIVYASRDQHENVLSVKDRDGTRTRYAYFQDPGNALHHGVETVVTEADGTKLAESRYEYFEQEEGRRRWTARMITVLDGTRTETEYSPAGLPVRIVRGTQETRFQYNATNQVIRKETPEDVTELEYHPTVGKVVRVRRVRRGEDVPAVDSRFEYDDSGNLTFAREAGGKSAKLTYDARGRIDSMTSPDRTITFKYDEAGRIAEIGLVGVGVLTVRYTASGEIDNVDSGGGRSIALAVTTAFQELLDMIRPAGVSLSF